MNEIIFTQFARNFEILDIFIMAILGIMILGGLIAFIFFVTFLIQNMRGK
jgi:hypothetical protein